MKWLSYLAILVLGVFIGYLGASLKIGAAMADADLGESKRVSEARVTELEGEVASLEAALEAKDREVAEAVAKAASLAEAAIADGEERAGGGEGSAASLFAGMMDNPVMKEQMKQQFKGQVAATFANLFRDQGFSDDEVAALSDILVERQMAITEAAMAAMAAGGIADEQKSEEASGKMKEVMESYNEELKALLGEAKFDEFKRYEETQAERQQLDSLRSQLASTEHPLSPDAEQKLMDVMWEVRQDPDFKDRSNISEVMSGTAMPDDPTQLIVAFGEMQAEVRERAQAFLEPEQLETLEASQKGFRDMMEMGLKMSAEMMGGGAKK